MFRIIFWHQLLWKMIIIGYAQLRNQMQNRVDAEIVVYSKQMSKARISEI